jgi:hypothetical protein
MKTILLENGDRESRNRYIEAKSICDTRQYNGLGCKECIYSFPDMAELCYDNWKPKRKNGAEALFPLPDVLRKKRK